MSLVQIIEKMLCTASSSGGEDTPTPEIIYGRIPIAGVGGRIIPYSSITEDMIKNCSQLVHGEVKTMGKTSLGLPSQTAEGDYCIVLVPKESGYTVTKDMVKCYLLKEDYIFTLINKNKKYNLR